MPSIAHLIMQTPQSNGGADLRTRSEDSSDDLVFWVLFSIFWGPAILVVILFLITRCARCICWDICSGEGKAWLIDTIYKNPRQIIRGFRKLCRKTPPQGTANEQQTTPESIEMGVIRREYMRSASPEGPPEYDYSYPEEPLPVYKR